MLSINKYSTYRFKWLHFVCAFLLLISFSSPFYSGSLSRDAKKEELSHYVAKTAKDKTDGKLLGITVGQTDENYPIIKDETEFYRLYGVFKQQSPTFGSGFNIHKNNKITISELGEDINFSIFYSAKDQSEPYGDHYKHFYYPFELMFPTERMYDIAKYMVYLSKSQADSFLRYYEIPMVDEGYRLEDYESLLKKTFYIYVDGVEYKSVICNIFYEQNYYYEAIKSLFANYVLCAYYCPGNLKRENMYFFNEHPYQVSYFMDYISENYPDKKYDVKVVQNNVLDKVDYSRITSFYYDNFEHNTSQILAFYLLGMLIVSVVSLVTYLNTKRYSLFHFLLLFLAIFIPYLLFFIQYKISYNPVLFSNYGILLYVFLIIFYTLSNGLVFGVGYIFNKKKKVYG